MGHSQDATFLIYVNISGKIALMPKTLPMVDISAPVCCAPVAAGPMSDDDALQVALRLKALADPARLKVMSFLFSSSAGEENSGELAVAVGLTESTVSHHLNQLRKAGLVESDRRGMNVLPTAPTGTRSPRCAPSSIPGAAADLSHSAAARRSASCPISPVSGDSSSSERRRGQPGDLHDGRWVAGRRERQVAVDLQEHGEVRRLRLRQHPSPDPRLPQHDVGLARST